MKYEGFSSDVLSARWYPPSTSTKPGSCCRWVPFQIYGSKTIVYPLVSTIFGPHPAAQCGLQGSIVVPCTVGTTLATAQMPQQPPPVLLRCPLASKGSTRCRGCWFLRGRKQPSPCPCPSRLTQTNNGDIIPQPQSVKGLGLVALVKIFPRQVESLAAAACAPPFFATLEHMEGRRPMWPLRVIDDWVIFTLRLVVSKMRAAPDGWKRAA